MTTRRSLHYADVVGGDQSVVSSRKTQDWHFVVLPMCIDLHVQAGDHVKRLCLMFVGEQSLRHAGLSWLSNFLRTLVRKSWSTVSNSPGTLCRISSSVAGLIPGERTSATPRFVLQISDRHLRRYPILIALVRDGASGDGRSVTCI